LQALGLKHSKQPFARGPILPDFFRGMPDQNRARLRGGHQGISTRSDHFKFLSRLLDLSRLQVRRTYHLMKIIPGSPFNAKGVPAETRRQNGILIRTMRKQYQIAVFLF
jgi:hypothetical protein